MSPLELAAFLCFIAANPFVVRQRTREGFYGWDLCWSAATPYFAILAIGSWFPYTYPYPRNPYLTCFVLLAVGIYAWLLYTSICAERPGEWRAAKQYPTWTPKPDVRMHGKRITCRSITFYAAVAAVVLLVGEFVINPGMRVSADLLQNREQFGNTSFFGTLGKVLSGAAILYLQVSWTNFLDRRLPFWGASGRFWSLLRGSIPFIVLAVIYLITGNRQFVFLGAVVVGLTAIYKLGVGVIFRPVALTLIASVVIVGVCYQFYRNRDSQGQQDEFLRNSINIQEKPNNWLSGSYGLNASGMLIFTYYGIEYNVFSAMVEGEIKYNAPMLGTVPIIYRRLQGPLRLSDQVETMSVTGELLKSRMNSFGVVWSTMFGSLFIEFGWPSLIGYILASMIAIVLIGKGRRRYLSQPVLAVGLCSALTFGMHYTLTIDNFGVCYLVMILTPGALWLKTEPASVRSVIV